MSAFFENQYLVDSRDVDPFNQCRPSAVLGILQEAATEAADQIHISRDDIIARYNSFWMLARIWYRLARPLYWNDVVTVKTWHRGGKGATMYRDFDLSVAGETVGEAVSTWVMAEMDTHKLFRMSNVTEFADTTGGELCRSMTLNKLHLPQNLPLSERRVMHYSDCDINGHVNNIKYADFVCDALRLEKMTMGQFVAQLQVGYLAECLPGETILIHSGEQEGQFYAHGVDEVGKTRFDAALRLGTL